MHNSRTESYQEQLQRTARYEALRPMSASEIVDYSLKLFRMVGGSILRPTVTSTVMVFISVLMVSQMLIPALFTTSNPDSVTGQVTEVAIAVLLGIFAAIPTLVIGLGNIAAHSVVSAKDYLMGINSHEVIRTKEVDEVLPKMIQLLTRMFFVASAGIFISVGFLLLGALAGALMNDRDLAGFLSVIGIIGFWISAVWAIRCFFTHSLAPSVLVMEGLSPKEAMKRSQELSKGQRYIPSCADTVFSVAGMMLFFTLIVGGAVSFLYSILHVVEFLSSLTAMYWWSEILIPTILGIPFLVTMWLILPAWFVGSTAIFFERRIRIDGFDVVMLNNELSSKNRR